MSRPTAPRGGRRAPAGRPARPVRVAPAVRVALPSRPRLRLACLALALTGGLAGGARAISPRACGTVVVPANVGVGSPTPATTMQPALFTSAQVEVELMQLMFRPLVRLGRDYAIDPGTGLAEAIDVSADRTVFTVTLKPWTWSDGSPVTAADVLLDWREIRELGAAYALYGTGGVPGLIRDVAALDARRVRFTLTRPVSPSWFERTGLTQFYALPSEDWGRLSLAEQQSRQSQTTFYRLSDGPFLLDRFVVGRFASFVPNPRYGGTHATIRRFVVDFLQGADPLQDLASGEVDMADLPPSVWKAADDLPGFARIPMGPAAATGTLIPNLESPSARFLADAGIRRAMSMAIDQRRLIDVVYHGQGEPVRGFVPTALTAFLPADLRSGHSPLDYDPAHAAAMLDAAGYRPGPDGIRRGALGRLEFEVLTTAGLASGILTMQLIADDLARVGIRMHVREVEFNQLIARMLGRPSGWEATYMSFTTNSFPDGAQLFASDSSDNYEHYADPEMDRLLAAATGAPGLDALYAVQERVVAQQPILFLPYGSVTVLARPGIGGIDRFVDTTGDWNPELLTLSKALSCDDANPPPPP